MKVLLHKYTLISINITSESDAKIVKFNTRKESWNRVERNLTWCRQE